MKIEPALMAQAMRVIPIVCAAISCADRGEPITCVIWTTEGRWSLRTSQPDGSSLILSHGTTLAEAVDHYEKQLAAERRSDAERN